jgi:hypothetical protein
MFVEYKITFEDGGVTIAQRVTFEPEGDTGSQTQSKGPAVAEQGSVGTSFAVASSKPKTGGGGEATSGTTGGGEATSGTTGGGEATSGTTGGGGPLVPGLIVVFGSLVAGGGLSSLGSGEGSSGTTGGQGKTPLVRRAARD